MAIEYQADLTKLIEETTPTSVLMIGPEGAAIVAAYLRAHPECTFTHLNGGDIFTLLEPMGTYDFVFISGTLEFLPKTSAEAVLSRVRDLHARRFALVVPIGAEWEHQASQWEQTELLALGMTCTGQYLRDGKPLHLYAFDIETYKTTPDWLNSKDWAHPELFDKYWW